MVQITLKIMFISSLVFNFSIFKKEYSVPINSELDASLMVVLVAVFPMELSPGTRVIKQ